jgi:hypothetical protein
MKRLLLNLLGLFLLTSLASTMNAQTAGTLTFTFTAPKHTTGNYETNGRYVIAVWIESCTPCGTTAGTSTFVKTKLRRWAGGTNDHLPTWVSKSGQSVVDATTGATSTTFTTQTVTWNGTNVAGAVVADGSYRVAVQETWGHGTATATRYFPFTKGTATDSQTPTADTNFTAMTLDWTPALAVENFDTTPNVVVYPNPSKGVFNIDFKNQVKNIKVVNVMGQVVYSETIDADFAETTKKIDLSSFSSGVYMIDVTNDKGTSTYKVLLDK